MARRRRECPFARCRRGLLAHRTALAAQKAQIQGQQQQQQEGHHELPPERSPAKLTREEYKHLLYYHSARQLRLITTNRHLSGRAIYLSRRPDRSMAFACVCGKQYMSRASMKNHYDKSCAQKPIPRGFPGVSFDRIKIPTQVGQDTHQEEDEEEGEEEEEDEENEENGHEPAHSYYTRSSNRITRNSAVRSFGAEFVQAMETTRCLQKQSLELHQKTINQLMELHQSAKDHIRELRQELQEERSTRRLALQALMEAQAAYQEERQEWTVERLSLLAHLETEQRERQEDQERISSIESRLKRSIMALGEDTFAYRTPSTSEDSPVFAKPIVFPGY